MSRSLATLFLFCATLSASAQEFAHPGLLHSRDDIEFIRSNVLAGRQPWSNAWAKLRAEGVSSLRHEARPVADVFRGRANNPDRGSSQLMHDSAAAYSHALQWCITSNRANAAKSVEILDAWSGTLRTIEGPDQQLLAGITAYKLCNAAELLRHSNSGWSPDGVSRFTNMMLRVFYPLIRDFKPKANGNWDAAMIVSMMCMAVTCEDRAMFARATDYFMHGEGNGCITNYVFATGQCQESTRDQPHAQLGLGMLAAACEVAKKQGLDLYGAYSNRLALGFEYTAKYNLGHDVPCDGRISAKGRGQFRPIYEKIYRHYAVEKGLPMPWTREVIQQIRPEGWSPDHESWGTLTYFKKP